MVDIALTRRVFMGAAALVGAGTVTGCSSLPMPTWLGGGPAGITGMLDRLDPATFLDDDRVVIQANWSRPQAVGEALEIDPSARLDDDSVPMARMRSVLATLPDELRVQMPDAPVDPWEKMTTRFLLTPAEAVSVYATPGVVALWVGGAELVEEIEPMLEGMFVRDGDTLRIDPELDPQSEDQFLSLIAPVGDDLVLTMEEDTSHVDTDASTMEHFDHLPALLEALDLEDAHLASAFRNRVEGRSREIDAHAPEWVWATRFDSPEEHTSLGAIHVDGDSAAFVRQMLDEEEKFYRDGLGVRPRIVDAELDGQIIRVTFANDPTTDRREAAKVGYLHRHSTVGGPKWTPLGY